MYICDHYSGMLHMLIAISFILVFYCCISFICFHFICSYSESSPLLLVSFDGFRYDYLTESFTPTIQRLSTCGVNTPYMNPIYPSYTFPNHYSITTVSRNDV